MHLLKTHSLPENNNNNSNNNNNEKKNVTKKIVIYSTSCYSSTSFAHSIQPNPMLIFCNNKPPTKMTSSLNKTCFVQHLTHSSNKFLHNLSALFHKTCCQIQQRNNRTVRFVSNHNFAAIIPGDAVAGVVAANGVINFLNLYNTLLVVRLVLTWFPSTPPAIVTPLSTICDPYLNIFRGIIPPLGGTLDLSPILAFLVLNAFTSTASALPAELPPTMEGHNQFPLSSSNLTSSSQKKWTKRLFQGKTKNSSNDN